MRVVLGKSLRSEGLDEKVLEENDVVYSKDGRQLLRCVIQCDKALVLIKEPCGVVLSFDGLFNTRILWYSGYSVAFSAKGVFSSSIVLKDRGFCRLNGG